VPTSSNTAGDSLEKALAHWSALPTFTILFLLSNFLIGIDITNIAISYLTVAILILTIGGDRRGRLALHAKLDDLEVSIPEADSSKARLEEKTEEEIEDKRKVL
jgi:low affinity Fe/Cu permease